MISERALGLALERTVLTSEQVERLRAIEAEVVPGVSTEPTDDESLRFVTGFADIFVTIGVVLFIGALFFLMSSGTGSTLAYAGVAACAWLLAEFFTLKRRMALPSIVLLVVFVAAVFVLAAQIFAALVPSTSAVARERSIAGIIPLDLLPLGLAALVTAALAALHYVRFRVPITVAAGTAALCVLALTLVVGFVDPTSETVLNAVLFACGVAVFALAMRFDMSDPRRLTRRTDIAFWLHLLAAPLIVHPLIRGFLHGLDVRLTTGAALGILWVFVALGILAVVIDRRAILVSGLVYAGFALSTLIRAAGLAGSTYLVPVVVLALGAFILLLSAGWHPLRRAILRRLPRSLAGRLPHPLVTSTT